MKSRTSFFNPTVLRKDITRFAPLWGLYTVFMLLTLVLMGVNSTGPAAFAANTSEILMGMGSVNIIYGGLCALLLFGDLFETRMAGALHAMPLRREGWFLTHFASGMLFCFVPNLLGAVLASMILQQYCYLAFLWLAIMLLQFLFFFGVGAFSAQCAGNKLGAYAVYGIFNLLAVLAAFLVTSFYEPALYGITINVEKICRLSPVVGFSISPYVAVEYDSLYKIARFEGLIWKDWRYLLIAAGMGVALLGVAVWLYQKRQLESAGDFIAVKPIAPIFLMIYTLCVGAVQYNIASSMAPGGEYLFLVIGLAIGIFTGSMLLEKKVNVFQKKKWILLGTVTAVLFLTIGITAIDPVGITRYVPEIERIETVQISSMPEYYDEDEPLVLSATEDIQKILDIHKEQVIQREDGEIFLRLRYNLKHGGVVERQYYIDPMSEAGQQIKKYYSSFPYVVNAESVEAVVMDAATVEYYNHSTNFEGIYFVTRYSGDNVEYLKADNWLTVGEEFLPGLVAAIQKDCEAGNMAQLWEYHETAEMLGTITITYVTYGGYRTRYADITVWTDCVNTVAYINGVSTMMASAE